MSASDHLRAPEIIVPQNEHLVLLIMGFLQDKRESWCESYAFVFDRPGGMFNTGFKYAPTVQPISRSACATNCQEI